VRISLFFAVALLCVAIQAADITPLDVKTANGK
jgi:hypothetical protein